MKTGLTQCYECPKGSFTEDEGSKLLNDCKCVEAYLDKATELCTQCPKSSEVTYNGATSIEACSCIEGYYGAPEDCEECIFPENCLGNTTCIKGFKGELCQACEDYYFRSELNCQGKKVLYFKSFFKK